MSKKIKTTDKFLEEAILKHGHKYDYSKVVYINNRAKVTINCPNHGDFEQIANDHLRGSGCPKCAIEKSRATLQKFIEHANKIHNNKYDYSKVVYINNKTKVTINCPNHGDFEQPPHDHSKGYGCLKCAIEKSTLTLQDFIEHANKIHNNKYDYSKVVYINNKTKVTINCPNHGDFEQPPHDHFKGCGCPKCSISISKQSQKWLDYLGIPNIMGQTREVWINLHNGKKIKADGFDPQTNTVYEFHGDYWHGNLNKYPADFINKNNKKTMEQLLKETQQKSRDIRNSGFNLKSIWESDWKKLYKDLKKLQKDLKKNE